ncbi:hypothetical protein LAM67_27280, partial [Mycobacterium tuberculosis]|nr:hypothetical protein [Mycobacterium tuberculosis]
CSGDRRTPERTLRGQPSRASDGVHGRRRQRRPHILPAWESRLLFADRYHRYVMQAEREMYEDSHLRGVICNAEMIKREIIED